MTDYLSKRISRRTLLTHSTALAATSMLPMPALAQGKKMVRMASINVVSLIPMFIAQDLGFFADEGIEAKILETHGGSQTNSALLSGDASVISTNFANPLLLAQQGKSVKSICGIEMNSVYAIVVRPDMNVPVDDIPALVKQLKGKRLGVASLGSGADTVASAFLGDNGLSSDDIIKVAVGSGGTAIAAMKARGVDAMVSFEPDLTQVVNSGVGKIAIDLRNTKTGTPYSKLPATSVQATAEWIKKEPETAAAVVRAIVRVNKMLQTDEAKSVAALQKRFPTLDAKVVAGMYAGERILFKSAIDKEQFEFASDILQKIKIIEKKAAYEQVVATEFAPLWG